MKKLSTKELRSLYLDFFKNHNHQIIPSSSVIPENDPTVLFTTAGMHPLVPYLLGEKHPEGNRLSNVQKCIRTSDIDEVGDNSHLTFFEMLGNWSLGDYFKEDAIKYSYEFLTSENYLNIDKEKLYFTCFKGDENSPKDVESYNIWLSLGVKEDHIFYLGADSNFWILGSGIGPCGPCSEMFFDTGKEKCSQTCNPDCSCGKYLEIWNDVFMQYKKDENGVLSNLSQHNVDTGMGLERTVAVLNGLESVYDIDVFAPLKEEIAKLSGLKYENHKKEFRIIMDHIRTATFILGDDHGLTPSNIGAGYVLRRLIRRVVRNLIKLNINPENITILAEKIINEYESIYSELKRNKEFIFDELLKEEKKFVSTLKDGERLFYKVLKKLDGDIISGEDAFKLFDTFGFPLEMTIELAKENNRIVDVKGFEEKFKEHQEKSRTIDAGSFKGGLADDSYESTKYHTLAHILLASLQKIYGKDVIQKGCNITSERIRFDFNLDHKLTDEEKLNLTNLVNETIKKNIDVTMEEMTYEEAKEKGAHGSFEEKYGSLVKVYSIGDFSKEICGGPHVKNTSELGTFKIIKEESSSAGVRRIKAVLED
ncbi:MAG: alanine--tRNA ligase [Firmicutes bacterium]|nr:alanine--tRNA ligase [Bacillota bacterium]